MNMLSGRHITQCQAGLLACLYSFAICHEQATSAQLGAP